MVTSKMVVVWLALIGVAVVVITAVVLYLCVSPR